MPDDFIPLEPLEEVEEAEEVIELEEEPSGPQEKKEDLLSLSCVQFLKMSIRESIVPTVITDPSFNYVWINDSYLQVFAGEVSSVGQNFVQSFSSTLIGSTRDALYKSVRDRKQGFSWRGRVETSGKEYSKVIANVLISPILVTNNDLIPSGYFITLDNITSENRHLLHNTFLSLLEASKLKDNDTGKHIERVNTYSKLISEELFKRKHSFQVDREFIDNIGFLAAMHDVGKIGTPDDILNKSGPLEEKEWNIMKEHTINGAYILSTYPNPMAKDIALFHHERWDGNGYPYTVSGEMIPLSARIVMLSDVYDALRMARTYKPPFSHDKALGVIKKERESHFDPVLTDLFMEMEGEFARIYSSMADEE